MPNVSKYFQIIKSYKYCSSLFFTRTSRKWRLHLEFWRCQCRKKGSFRSSL